MTEAQRVIRALRRVPQKRLKLVALASQLCTLDGTLDEVKYRELEPQLASALDEAGVYGQETRAAVQALRELL